MNAINRTCFVLRVRPDRLEEYKARHRDVWPEMLEALSAAGWSNYSLFARADGLLVGYVEADDFAAAQAAMEGTEVNTRWQAEMSSFFELPDGGRGGRADLSMIPLEEVFHLD